MNLKLVSIRCLIALCLVVFSLAGYAASSANSFSASAELKRMSNAFETAQYDGVFIYSQGRDVKTLRVIHKVEKGIQKERLIHLDGVRFELIRNGDNLVCVLPKDVNEQAAHKVPPRSFAQSFVSDVENLKQNYSFDVMDVQRFLGRDTLKVSINPKNNDRFSYTLWLDKTSGLLLKSILNDNNGIELERFQFSSLEIGKTIPDYLFMVENSNEVNIVTVPQSTVANVNVPSKGWVVDWVPPGFSSMMNDDVMVPNAMQGMLESMHAYSDGLFSFSIFIEKNRHADGSRGHSSMGATTVINRVFTDLKSNYRITLVGELPLSVARKIIASVKPK